MRELRRTMSGDEAGGPRAVEAAAEGEVAGADAGLEVGGRRGRP